MAFNMSSSLLDVSLTDARSWFVADLRVSVDGSVPTKTGVSYLDKEGEVNRREVIRVREVRDIYRLFCNVHERRGTARTRAKKLRDQQFISTGNAKEAEILSENEP